MMKLSEAQIKEITTSFSRHWGDLKEANTAQGFDDWWKGVKGHYEFLDVPDVIRQLKKIDMSVAISSGIDCEFSDNEGEYLTISKLKKIDTEPPMFMDIRNGLWTICRPRMNHIHATPNGSDECPIPEGFIINISYRDPKALADSPSVLSNGLDATEYTWKHAGGVSDIIAFEVIRLADGFKF